MVIPALESKIIIKIGCGDFHSVALEDNGNLYSWGKGDEGECGHGKMEDCETPMKIKFFNTKTVVDVVTGNHHTLAVTDKNELYSWGQGSFGQCGYGEFENTGTPQLILFPDVN